MGGPQLHRPVVTLAALYGASSGIAAWPKQMHTRGAAELQGTSQFGPLTAAVVQRVQSVNGILQSGRIGPLTWAAAWSGRY